MKPSKPDIYHFTGYRKNSRGIVTINDLVEVRPLKWKPSELAVFFFGKDDPFPPEAFVGTFKKLEFDFGGERK